MIFPNGTIKPAAAERWHNTSHARVELWSAVGLIGWNGGIVSLIFTMINTHEPTRLLTTISLLIWNARPPSSISDDAHARSSPVLHATKFSFCLSPRDWRHSRHRRLHSPRCSSSRSPPNPPHLSAPSLCRAAQAIPFPPPRPSLRSLPSTCACNHPGTFSHPISKSSIAPASSPYRVPSCRLLRPSANPVRSVPTIPPRNALAPKRSRSLSPSLPPNAASS